MQNTENTKLILQIANLPNNNMENHEVCYPQQSSNIKRLIADDFIWDNQLTYLQLYPHQIKLTQRYKEQIIPLSLDFTFIILYDQHTNNANGIQFYHRLQDLRITLTKHRWQTGLKWERYLIQYGNRGDFHTHYKPIRKIGKGGFAQVFLTMDIQKGSPMRDREVAIKSFLKNEAFKNEGRQAIQNEINLMRRIDSPNVIKFYGVCSSVNSLYLAIEYINGTTLQNFLRINRTPTVQIRKKILKALLVGIADLQKQRIIHRDLKPQNIMIDSTLDSIKIVDFGLATHIDDPKYIYARCGTPGYVAPEIINIKNVEAARMTIQSDMFSLGAIHHRMLYGKPLFDDKDPNVILLKNRQCRITYPYRPDVGKEELILLVSMLQVNPSQRISAQDALQSKFMVEQCRPLQLEGQSTDWRTTYDTHFSPNL